MKNLKLVLASLFVAGISFAQTADEIVKKHIEAVGGKDNWAKIKSLRMECTMKAQGAEIKTTITQVDKKAMRQDVAVMGMNGWSILTTSEGWNYMPFGGQTKPEPMTADDVKSAQDGLEISDDFITYKDQGKKLEYIGKDEMDGTECFKLKMTDKNGQETTYFVDAETYYIIKQTQKVKANGKEVEASTTYGNFKKLPEGIVWAMTIGGGWGNSEVVKLEINPAVDESIFKPSK